MIDINTYLKDFNVLHICDLSDVTMSVNHIYTVFEQCQQAKYEPLDRIVFYTEHVVPDDVIKHMYHAAKTLDISACFVLICSKHDIKEQVRALALTNDQYDMFNTMVCLVESKELNTNFVFPSTICPMPWSGIEVFINGNIRPCCVYNGTIGHIDEGLDLVFNNKHMTKIREEMLAGKQPSGCSSCWSNESVGVVSHRIRHLANVKEKLFTQFLIDKPKIRSLDLKPNNTCNFSCRICTPGSSSKIAQESITHKLITQMPKSRWGHNDQTYIKDIVTLLPDLTSIDLYGGEPFLIKHVDTIINKAVESNHSSHIKLHFNTNGSVFPDSQIESWSKFEYVNLLISIDNVGPRFEIERGGKWSDIVNNVSRFCSIPFDNFKVSIMTTVSLLNVLYLNDVYDWADQHKLAVELNYLHIPNELSIANSTQHTKQLIHNTYKNSLVPDLQDLAKMILKTEPVSGTLFVNKMDQYDRFRNQDFRKTHLEIIDSMSRDI